MVILKKMQNCPVGLKKKKSMCQILKKSLRSLVIPGLSLKSMSRTHFLFGSRFKMPWIVKQKSEQSLQSFGLN